MKTRLLIFAFLLALSSKAQNYELGKVSKAELEQARHPDDTSAVAAILFKKAETKFKYFDADGFESYTEVTIRIKIYKKEGLEWANFEVPYYVGYQNLDDEAISFSKGMTYNLEDGKIVKTKVANENMFKKKIDEFWHSRSVTFPNVKVGSVLEIRYLMKSQNLSMLPDFRFQYSIPVDFAEYRIEAPEFYLYQGVLTGYVRVNTDSKIEMASQSFTNKYKQTMRLSYNQIVTTYTATEVPALIEEEYVDNIHNYYGKIDHELQVIRMPDSEPKQIATSWEDVAKSIYDDDEFGKELEKYQYFANDIPTVVGNKNTKSEKAEAIFEYVKNRMTWNERYGYATRDGVEKAYANRTGNVAEINLMLVAMLRMAGLDANPVLLSTRENGKAPFPSRMRLNYVVASVMTETKMQLFDATYKLAAPNVLPLRDLNGTGRMIQKGGIVTEVPLVPTVLSNETVLLMADIDSEGIVSGKVRQQFTNHNAYLFRDRFIGMDRQQFLEKEEQKHQIEIADYTVENESALAKPLTVDYTFTSDNSVEIIGDKMYLSPLLFFAQQENPFKQDFRAYPVDFIFPTQDKFTITLTIPEGYSVETMPAGLNLAMDDKMGNFRYTIENTGNKIQLLATFDITKPLFQSEKYDMLKKFFRTIISKQNEKIILKKV